MTSVRFGKHPPKLDYRTLRFRSYVTPKLQAPPPQFNVLTRVYDHTKVSDPTKLYPIDGNDTLGDCTIAAMAHAITTYRALPKPAKPFLPSAQNVVKLYRHLTGGPDTGLNELDVLNYWRQHKSLGDGILGYVSVDPKNHQHVQQALALFGGVYLGFQVQQNCLEEFNAHQPWTPGPLTQEGHAVFAVAYDASALTVLTWGNTQQATWAWWDECVDEAYAILPQEASDPNFAPGLNLTQLQQDLAAVAH